MILQVPMRLTTPLPIPCTREVLSLNLCLELSEGSWAEDADGGGTGVGTRGVTRATEVDIRGKATAEATKGQATEEATRGKVMVVMGVDMEEVTRVIMDKHQMELSALFHQQQLDH